jgi:hypothetical protein
MDWIKGSEIAIEVYEENRDRLANKLVDAWAVKCAELGIGVTDEDFVAAKDEFLNRFLGAPRKAKSVPTPKRRIAVYDIKDCDYSLKFSTSDMGIVAQAREMGNVYEIFEGKYAFYVSRCYDFYEVVAWLESFNEEGE